MVLESTMNAGFLFLLLQSAKTSGEFLRKPSEKDSQVRYYPDDCRKENNLFGNS
jgi:hypothetical protein